MKQIIFFTICLFCGNIYAQTNFNYHPEVRQFMLDKLPMEHLLPEGVQQVTFDIQDVKKNKTARFVKQYNKDGKPVSYTRIAKDGTEQPIISVDYDDNGQITEAKRYRKGKLKETHQYQRTDADKPLQQTVQNKKGNITKSSAWTYNEDGCMTRCESYGKNNAQPRSFWVIEYAEDCKKSKSTWYNKKGKVKGIWTYDCNDIQRQKKSPPKFQHCRWEETTDIRPKTSDHQSVVLEAI